MILNLVNSFGDGLFLSGNAVFATKVLGFGGGQVGLGISCAGVAGLVAAGVMGALADKVGARRLLGILTTCQVAIYLLYTTVHSFPLFVVVICLMAVCKNGAYPASAALVARIGTDEGRVRLRAQARSSYNVGFSLGAALAALTLGLDSRPTYYLLPIGNALSFAAVAAITRTLPETSGTSSGRKRVLGALRDGRFLLTTFLTGILAMHASLIVVVLPLWIVERTTIPHAMIGVLLVINTTVAIVFQVRVSRGAESLVGSIRKVRLAGGAMAAACVVLAASGAVDGPTTILLAVVAVVLLTLGEILQSAAAWGMSYALAPQGAQAEYLGAFAMSNAGEAVIAPALGTALVLQHGAVGWGALGVLLVLASLAVGPAATHAERSIRARYGQAVVAEAPVTG